MTSQEPLCSNPLNRVYRFISWITSTYFRSIKGSCCLTGIEASITVLAFWGKKQLCEVDHQGDRRQGSNTKYKFFLVLIQRNAIIPFGGFPEALNGITLREKHSNVCFNSPYTKNAMMQRSLAWSLYKNNMYICEVFSIFFYFLLFICSRVFVKVKKCFGNR